MEKRNSRAKDELLVAVLQEASERYCRQMEAMAPGPRTGEGTDAGLAEPQRRVAEQPEWYRLRYELFALGLRNPAIRPVVALLLANGRQGIAATSVNLAGAELPDATAVGAILLACFDGLALQKLADPAFDLALVPVNGLRIRPFFNSRHRPPGARHCRPHPGPRRAADPAATARERRGGTEHCRGAHRPGSVRIV